MHFVAVDSFIGLSMAMTMVSGQTAAIVAREKANNMYSARQNFLITWLAAAVSFLPYPLISAVLTFHFIEVGTTTSFNQWLAVITFQSVSGMSFGFMVGALCGGSSAPVWCQGIITCVSMCSGFFVNGGTINPVVQALRFISPFRYAIEALLRVLVADKEYGDMVLS